MTMENGRFVGASADDMLTVLMENARQQFGDDLNDNEEAIIRTFYVPVANLLESVQADIATVLDSAQLDYAEGMALDLLVALIGVSRQPAVKATGEVTFSRESASSNDYTIPKGTVVQTDSNDPREFKTTEAVTLPAGDTSVTGVAIEALEAGSDSNVGANTITEMVSPPTGIEDVTNPAVTDGGSDEETDDDLRARAQDELSDGMRGTARAILVQLLKTEDVKSVSLFINDSDTTDGDGLKPQHTECVVEGGTDADVGQTIFDTKAAGDGTQGGIHGTSVTVSADLPNGQTHDVDFSRATEIQIYVDMDLDVNEQYGGDSAVQDAIVRYLGGLLSTGMDEDGELRVGDDVIYTKIMSAIHSVDGVDDVPDLNVGKSASPTGTSNIAVTDTEVATSDATDSSITITEV